ncbi:hypothetical protein [Burkholderia multivorans]|uniref:hypothetical protein n=1 Tax=Burkholderia multivorans TaxID=87883 RepID=UPI00350F03D5
MRVVASVINAVVPANGAALIAHATAAATTLERIDLAIHVLLIIVLPVRTESKRCRARPNAPRIECRSESRLGNVCVPTRYGSLIA